MEFPSVEKITDTLFGSVTKDPRDMRHDQLKSAIAAVYHKQNVGRLDPAACPLEHRTAVSHTPRQLGTTTAVANIFDVDKDIYVAPLWPLIEQFTDNYLGKRCRYLNLNSTAFDKRVEDVFGRIYPAVRSEILDPSMDVTPKGKTRIFFDGFRLGSHLPPLYIRTIDSFCQKHKIDVIYIIC